MVALDATLSAEGEANPLVAALQGLRAENLVSVPLLAGGWLTGILQVAAAPGGRVTVPFRPRAHDR